MTTNINFDGLKMVIENYRIAPRVRRARRTEDYSVKEYVEQKDFERVFNMPVKSTLKADVEDKLIDLKDGNVVERFVLPWSYSTEDEEEYKEFLAFAIDRVRNLKGYKLVEERINSRQRTFITIIKM